MSAKHESEKSKKRILDDHVEIATLLEASVNATQASEIVANMTRLRALLGRHFAEEESELGGLHESNQVRAPRHANSIASLKIEHRDMLEKVREILEGAEKPGSDVAKLCALSKELQSLFVSHEARETEIFVDSVWTDIGTKD
jgi:hemerythrin